MILVWKRAGVEEEGGTETCLSQGKWQSGVRRSRFAGSATCPSNTGSFGVK